VTVGTVNLFRDLGFEVLDAYNGDDALRLIRTHPGIGLLFADVRMPRMDGLTLAEAAHTIAPTSKWCSHRGTWMARVCQTMPRSCQALGMDDIAEAIHIVQNA
jgi:CheY-like chemotaxis protein